MLKSISSEVVCHEASKGILSTVLKEGARRLLAQAVDQEVSDYIATHMHERDDDGHRLVVRNGYLPQRGVQTGLGEIKVTLPRVNDKRVDADGNRKRFQSSILPPYLRKTKEIEELIPWLYLKGISTGDFSDALVSLVGENAKGFSATTVVRLKEHWQTEFKSWSDRSLKDKRYVYFWADGVYFNIRLEDDRQCILVIMGALEDGTKELVAVVDGARESEMSWTHILLDLKARGLEVGPNLAVGDGSLGFWNALEKVYPTTKHQRCWVHKTANVLNKLPTSQQPLAKTMLNDIFMAATKKDALIAWDIFSQTLGIKYPKAVDCLEKDKDVLLTYYSFPAEHWCHIRSSNPIESLFATVRLRHKRTKGSATASACLAMVFKLAQNAEKGWKRLRGSKYLADVANQIEFVDGVRNAA